MERVVSRCIIESDEFASSQFLIFTEYLKYVTASAKLIIVQTYVVEAIGHGLVALDHRRDDDRTRVEHRIMGFAFNYFNKWRDHSWLVVESCLLLLSRQISLKCRPDGSWPTNECTVSAPKSLASIA